MDLFYPDLLSKKMDLFYSDLLSTKMNFAEFAVFITILFSTIFIFPKQTMVIVFGGSVD